jgi:DNA-binding response OmpR family regulator
MRILLVEDHQDSADMLALVLRGNGHDVLAVGTAGDALRACGEASFDLLISDIGLPDFDGWDLLARVRENCGIPAIALTALGSNADRERSRAAGFDAHLAKPVEFKTLTAVVARYGAPAA